MEEEHHEVVEEIAEEPGEPFDFVIPTQGKFFDDPNEEL